jgi:hypothetical protein
MPGKWVCEREASKDTGWMAPTKKAISPFDTVFFCYAGGWPGMSGRIFREFTGIDQQVELPAWGSLWKKKADSSGRVYEVEGVLNTGKQIHIHTLTTTDKEERFSHERAQFYRLFELVGK